MTHVLTEPQITELHKLIFKIRDKNITHNELDRFQYLIRKTNYAADVEFKNFLIMHGYSDVKNFLDDYHNKKNKEFIDSLVKIGLGILAAYAISRLLKKK